MVIDDDPLFHRVMQHRLRNNAAYQQVSYSLSAKAVLDMLIEQRHHPACLPDIIFLDLEMPELNGWTFLQFLEQVYTSLAKKIQVYIISASSLFADKLKSSNYPFVHGFFSKERGLEFATGSPEQLDDHERFPRMVEIFSDRCTAPSKQLKDH